MLRPEEGDEEDGLKSRGLGGGGSSLGWGSSLGEDPVDCYVSSGGGYGMAQEGAAPLTVEYVGRLRVTVVGPLGKAEKLSIVAVHDIGTNAETCFGQFLDHCRQHGMGQYTESVQFYIDIQGHEEDAPQIPDSDPWYTLRDFAEELTKVIARFRIGRFIGFGVGAGASLLIQFASKHPKALRGLVMVSPAIRSASILERIYFTTAVYSPSYEGWNNSVKQRLLTRWLSPTTLERDDVMAKYASVLDRLNPFNLARYFYAYANRPDLSAALATLRTRTLIIVGNTSPLYEDSYYAFSSMPPEQTSMMELRGGGTVCLDEDMDKCAEAVKLFLQGFGAV